MRSLNHSKEERQFTRNLVFEIDESDLKIWEELGASIVLSGHVIASTYNYTNTYTLFEDEIDKLAREYKRRRDDDWLYEAVSLDSEHVVNAFYAFVQSINKLLGLESEQSNRFASAIGDTNVRRLEWLVSNAPRLEQDLHKSLGILQEVSEGGDVDPTIRIKNILVKSSIEVLLALLHVIYGFLRVVMEEGTNHIGYFVSVFLEFVFQAILLTSNILGNWARAAIMLGPHDLTPIEVVITMLAIGCMIHYMVGVLMKRRTLVNFRFIANKLILKNLSAVLRILDNINSSCEQTACFSNSLSKVYSDTSKLSHFKMLISFYNV